MTPIMKIGMVALAVVLVLSVAAIAAPAAHAMSCDGAVHGAFANINGPFGWLGLLGGAAGYHGVVGQAVGATGYNNSQASADCNN